MEENRGDLICRQAVINAIANTCFWLSAKDWEELTKCIDSIPPVEDKGEWFVSHTDIDELWAICSNCDEEIKQKLNDDYTPVFYNFCPNCGADMRQTKEKRNDART